MFVWPTALVSSDLLTVQPYNDNVFHPGKGKVDMFIAIRRDLGLLNLGPSLVM